jgi:galactonate dehydratase
MKIAGLKTFVVGNPPPSFGGQYFIFVKLVTDDGIEGIGEVYGDRLRPQGHGGGDRGHVSALCRGHGPVPYRETVAKGLWLRLHAAPRRDGHGVLSGIEIALWDIKGKALGKPVYELLGGLVHERIRSYTYIYPIRRRAGQTASTGTRKLPPSEPRIM